MAPLVPLALALAFGVWAGCALPLPWPALLLAAAIVCAWALRARALVVPCAVWLALGLVRVAAWQAHPAMALASRLPRDPEAVALHVRLERALPDAAFGRAYLAQALHQRVAVGWAPLTGRLRVLVPGEFDPLEAGAELLLEGRWARIRAPTNPGEPDHRARWAGARVFGEVRLRAHDPVVRLPDEPGGAARAAALVRSWFEQARGRSAAQIARALPARQAGVLRSLVLGQRATLEAPLREAFIDTGTMHLLVVSGGNVALIAWLIAVVLCLSGLPWRARLVVSGAALGGYCLLTGAEPPVIRATLMAWVLLAARFGDRELSWLNALALAGIVMLLADPMALRDPSAQLSFGAVATLVLLAPAWCRWLEARLAWVPRWAGRRALAVGLGATAAVSVGLLPVLAWYFNQVTPVALLANVAVAPCFALLVLGGTAGLAAGSCWPPAWHALALPLGGLVELALLLVRWCHAVPYGALPVPRPPLWMCAAYYGLLGTMMAWPRLGAAARRLAAGGAAAAALVIAAGAAQHAWGRAPQLVLELLDVEHGDAMVLRSPGGRVWVIDAGNEAMGRARVLPFLRAAGIGTLEALVLTHADADHLGGAIPLLQHLTVRRVLTNGEWDGTMCARAVRDLAARRRVPVVSLAAGDDLQLEPGVRVRVLHPPRAPALGVELQGNDRSLVLQVAYGQARLLLTGDIEEQGLPVLLREPQALASWALKMPHHGSGLGWSGEALLQAVRPSVALISVGRRPGLPSAQTLAGLRAAHIPTLMTRDDGAIRLATDGVHMTLETFHAGARLACRLGKCQVRR